MQTTTLRRATLAALFAFGATLALPVSGALAYDGTKCRAPGNCWEPKPGFPDKVAGSKYDPKHNPTQLNKQSESIAGMEARNAKRVANFNKTGKWENDVSKIAD
ncbi:methanol dehydrogenase (cytochrome) small subunit [Arboricoccus pini]|uniref:Methanol dehydrogenase [cytochrome c] subunit 2 n=1 Tax=Arboricoccus pini TaxID=1963835 RepID=A0A212R0K4_9PROT|nr:methanol dehydrogenase [cytochrome c] subunit [Arboricoccus pini]SNB65524.1 methanol dehydrogenase (cytochrome) small subunit [Arboricoccus pini]